MLQNSKLILACRFMLQEEIEDELCSNDPWLVLHKIDSPTKMRFMGNRVAQCNASDLDPTVVAPSIARFVGGKGMLPTHVMLDISTGC